MNWIVQKPIAHRGLHNGCSIPENSLVAFESAIRHNYPIELDIHLLSDGSLAVFHDQYLTRMTGINGKLAEHNSSTVRQLKLLDSDQYIPLIEEVFELVNGKVPILIEIKNKGKVGKIEPILLNKLSHYYGEYAVQSFNPFSIAWFKNNAPNILRGQLSTDFKFENLEWHKKIFLKNLLTNWVSSPNFIGYDIQNLPYFPVTLARQVFNCPILAWTVKNEEDKIKASKYADNFIFENIKP